MIRDVIDRGAVSIWMSKCIKLRRPSSVRVPPRCRGSCASCPLGASVRGVLTHRAPFRRGARQSFSNSFSCQRVIAASCPARFDDTYANWVRSFDWQTFYENYAEALSALMEEMARKYDYVLI